MSYYIIKNTVAKGPFKSADEVATARILMEASGEDTERIVIVKSIGLNIEVTVTEEADGQPQQEATSDVEDPSAL